jgi:hypothetical protein
MALSHGGWRGERLIAANESFASEKVEWRSLPRLWIRQSTDALIERNDDAVLVHHRSLGVRSGVPHRIDHDRGRRIRALREWNRHAQRRHIEARAETSRCAVVLLLPEARQRLIGSVAHEAQAHRAVDGADTERTGH